jgi:hypothetical protein
MRYKKLLSVVNILFVSTLYAGNTNVINVHVLGGLSVTWLSNNQTVDISPYTNQYDSTNGYSHNPMFGVGAEYIFTQPFAVLPSLAVGFGVTGYSVNYNTLSGTEHPFVNGGTFDTLNYSFNNHSYGILFEPRLIYTQTTWQPYVLGGLGLGINRSSNYQEYPTNPNGGAQTAPSTFQSATNYTCAYELGLGIQRVLYTSAQHVQLLTSLDYRYLNFGKASLGPVVGQSTGNRLSVPVLGNNVISLGLALQF